jgi:hypothetical protein
VHVRWEGCQAHRAVCWTAACTMRRGTSTAAVGLLRWLLGVTEAHGCGRMGGGSCSPTWLLSELALGWHLPPQRAGGFGEGRGQLRPAVCLHAGGSLRLRLSSTQQLPLCHTTLTPRQSTAEGRALRRTGAHLDNHPLRPPAGQPAVVTRSQEVLARGIAMACLLLLLLLLCYGCAAVPQCRPTQPWCDCTSLPTPATAPAAQTEEPAKGHTMHTCAPSAAMCRASRNRQTNKLSAACISLAAGATGSGSRQHKTPSAATHVCCVETNTTTQSGASDATIAGTWQNHTAQGQGSANGVQRQLSTTQHAQHRQHGHMQSQTGAHLLRNWQSLIASAPAAWVVRPVGHHLHAMLAFVSFSSAYIPSNSNSNSSNTGQHPCRQL